MRVPRRKHMALHRGHPERWSMDFVHPAFADGRPFPVLTGVDQWSQSPLLEVAPSMSGGTVGHGLDRVLTSAQRPQSSTVDHGTEFTSRAFENWAFYRGVQLDFHATGERDGKRHRIV
jgi:putative transposase